MDKLNEGSVEETLKQRGTIYGTYRDGVVARANILIALKQHHWQVKGIKMNLVQQVWISDLIIKLVRLSASPEHTDSAHDLSGYSKLIEDMLNEEAAYDSPTRD